jgi:alpha-glucosidase
VSKGGFDVTQKLDEIVVLGTGRPGGQVTLQDQKIIGWKFIPAQNKLVVPGLQADLNEPVVLTW